MKEPRNQIIVDALKEYESASAKERECRAKSEGLAAQWTSKDEAKRARVYRDLAHACGATKTARENVIAALEKAGYVK